jgi:hypothetical protein
MHYFEGISEASVFLGNDWVDAALFCHVLMPCLFQSEHSNASFFVNIM